MKKFEEPEINVEIFNIVDDVTNTDISNPLNEDDLGEPF